jgi:xanthine dehydrogenase accessory factor
MHHAGAELDRSSEKHLVLVRSAGNVGSAVARALHQAHLPVVLLQDGEMATLRWQMSYAQALQEGSFYLEGVPAWRVRVEYAAALAQQQRSFIPLIVGSMRAALEYFEPTIIVDACIKGAREPINPQGSALLTIGIGPRFSAGDDVDLVVESAWGASLGAVIANGRAERRSCNPETIAGLSWARFARSPKAGVFRTARKIGEIVRRENAVCRIDDLPVTAPISGTIRGLLPDGAHVQRGNKVLEIDPRVSDPQYSGVGERSKRIAAGVLNAIFGTLPAASRFDL